MYHSPILSISPIDNGYLITFTKQVEEEDMKDCPCVSSYNEREKTAFFKSEADVAKAVAALLPKLVSREKEDDFDTAFEESIK